MSRKLIRFLWFIILFSPLFVLLIALPQFQNSLLNLQLDFEELFWSLRISFLQALFSALISLIFGAWCSFGLLSLQGKWLRWRGGLELFLLTPSFLPSIYIILACFHLVDPFPMGLWGVVLIHTIMNVGLISVLFRQLLEVRMASLSEVSWIMGIGRFQFLRHLVWPSLKSDILRMGFFVFALCFTSFTVPLIVGMGRVSTLEVLIYEKIRLDFNWSQALLLSWVQIFLLLGFAQFIYNTQSKAEVQWKRVRLLQQKTGLILIVLLTTALYVAYGNGFIQGLQRWSELWELRYDLGLAFLRTYFLSIFCGFIFVISYLSLAYIWPDIWLERLLNGFVAPSTVIIGFGVLILFQWFQVDSWILRLAFSYWLMIFPMILRWGGISDLNVLKRQIETAWLLGASRVQIFASILWPQLLPRAFWLGAIGSFWVAGDFALAKILLNQDLTLGLITGSFLSSYRLHLGTAVSGVMILTGLLSFLTLMSLSYVRYRKFKY